ncbi:type II secretion system F family protein [Sphingomonas sp. NSE70-1]|uniref:Type II secretion system F family protein n=1 Tax=Sphingomonas caseinilyticus TaxID=2908205 RepID=A0ABT0RV46_9SPHN|nr:type II secretion system F family protein [Sphingomonas caseinilyticus]MCL6698914.1 type II secretion system F family protein [Sphingomonas caseinilyticus]
MSDIWIKAIILVLVFAAVVFAVERVLAVYIGRNIESKAINKRLDLIGRGHSRGDAMQMLRRQVSALPDKLPPLLVRPAIAFEKMLVAAGLAMPTGRLMLLLLAAPIVIFLMIILLMLALGGALGFGRILMIATFAFVLGAAIPLLVLQIRANRMRKKMQDQFPVALDVFVRGLRAGHPIAAALDLLTVEMADPIGSQFGIVVDEVTYGADLRDALTAMAERWDLDDMRMFVVALSVQSETGGNLAEILENLSKVIRERQSMMLKVRALSSEGRMTAAILTGLPVMAFSLLFLANPRFYLDVADDPAFLPGYVSLLALYAIGFFTIRRLIDLKV